MNALGEPMVLADGLDHPEGVAWSPRGRLYAGGEAGQIYEVRLDGAVRLVADTGGFILGLALDGDDRLYACDMRRRQVIVVDPESGAVDVLSAGAPDMPMRVPNWLAFDPAGNLYVTDSGDWRADDGLVFRIAPDGTTSVWTDAVPHYPNGCCVDAAGEGLYVVESTAPAVSRVPIGAGGAAGAPETIARLPGTVPDGVLLTADGELLVMCYRPDRIYRVTAGSVVTVVADDPHGAVLNQPTNAAFAGAALDRLVIANLGGTHLSICETALAGAVPHLPRLPETT